MTTRQNHHRSTPAIEAARTVIMLIGVVAVLVAVGVGVHSLYGHAAQAFTQVGVR